MLVACAERFSVVVELSAVVVDRVSLVPSLPIRLVGLHLAIGCNNDNNNTNGRKLLRRNADSNRNGEVRECESVCL